MSEEKEVRQFCRAVAAQAKTGTVRFGSIEELRLMGVRESVTDLSELDHVELANEVLQVLFWDGVNHVR